MDSNSPKVTPFDKIMKVLGTIQNIFSIVPLVAMCFIVLASVIMRYVLKVPFTWGEEAARYLMVFASMIAIGMGVREKAHLGVTMIVGALPKKIQFYVSAFAQVLVILIFGLLAYLSSVFIRNQYQYGQTSAALKLPMYLVYGMMLMGFGFGAIEGIYVFYRDYIRKEPLDKKEEIV